MPHEAMTEEPARGQRFGVDELGFALGILAELPVPGVRAAVTTDHEAYPEMIEITPPRSAEPVWFIWKRLDDGWIVVDGVWKDGRLVFGRMEDALAAVGLALIKGAF